jgi:Glycosyl transferase family 90
VQYIVFIVLTALLAYAFSMQRERGITAQLDWEISLLDSVKSSMLLRTSSAVSGGGGSGVNGETTLSPATIKSSASSSTSLLRVGGGGTNTMISTAQGGVQNNNNSSAFLKFDFDSDKREDRFPSVEERVKVYMSDWYVVPCPDHAVGEAESPMVRYHYVVDNDNHGNDNNNNNNNSNRTRSLIVNGVNSSGNQTSLQVHSSIESDLLFYLDPSRLSACYDDADNAARVYCRDVFDSIVSLLTATPRDDDGNNATTSPPLLFQFGDMLASRHYGNVQVPHIRKFRRAMDQTELAEITTAPTCHVRASSRARPASGAGSSSSTVLVRGGDDDTATTTRPPFQGILWKLNTKRHFGDIGKVLKSDVAWSEKKNKAIFWGGPNQPDHDDDNSAAATARRLLLRDSEKCHAMPRCRFVLMYANSTLVEAKLSKTRDIFASHVIDGVAVTTPKGRKSVTEVIKYKAIIMLEGNDVASGLKWSLYSNSVVLMTPPTFTSFAMEELLVPYVHYVPLRPDLSNAQEQMQWILDNDEQAQKIAQTGKQWVHDLLFHPDAARDNELVNREILKRYRMHFEQDDTLSV